MNRRALAPLAVSALAALLAAASGGLGWFSALDKAWYDLALRAHLLDYPDDIAIVAIDETSLDSLGAWPWDRRYHARLVERLQGTSALVFDLLFAESQHDSVDRPGPPAKGAASADEELGRALQAHARVLLPVYIEQQQYRGLMQEILPIPELASAASSLGHAHVEYGADGIARGIYLRMGLGKPYWPHMALALAEFKNEMPDSGRWQGDAETASPYQIYVQHFSRLRFAGAPRTVYRFSYVDVLEGRVPDEALRDKTVFVGATATGLGDDVPTPFGAMPGVEFHANAYHALRSDGLVDTLSRHESALLHGLLALFACLALSRMTPRAFLPMTLLALLAFAVVVTALFFLAALWVRPTPFLFALAVFYPLWSWRRIEIAMGFLREELAALQRVPSEGRPRAEAIEAQLQQLVDLGVMREANMESVGVADDSQRWPQYRFDGKTLHSEFALDGKVYSLRLAASGEAGDQDGAKRKAMSLATLACLMEGLPGEDSQVDDSYELVERTIKEIYAARQVVERTRERMSESMARLQDIVVVSDIAGRIVFVNESGDRYFEPGLAGRGIDALHKYLGQPVWQAIVRQVMVDGEQVYRELETQDRKLLLCQAARLRESEPFRDTLLFVFTDVTELRALEQGKNEALAFLSHDMRSPLVSQLALIERSRSASDGFSGDENQLLDKLVFFAERSLKYSEDFLQLARAENLDQGSFQLVDLHGVVDAAIAEVGGLALQQGLQLEIARSDADCWMLGDAQLLERAVSNLLANAIQYSPKGGVVTVGVEAGDLLSVSVEDRGRGIDAEALPHLFKPYFRARRQARQQGGESSDAGMTIARNYGLGLSFVHSVVERHGGRIDVQSQPGKGTRITLLLPATELE